jgi:hypothetical protein
VISGRRDDGRDHDHGLAGGRYRDPHGPNVPRGFASLRDSGRNADDSSTPLQMEDVPSAPGPTCNGDQLVPSILPTRRSPDLESVHTPQSGSAVAGSRCTPKSAPNSARQPRLRAARHRSNSVSFCISPFGSWPVCVFPAWAQDYYSVSSSCGKVTGVIDLYRRRPKPDPSGSWGISAGRHKSGRRIYIKTFRVHQFLDIPSWIG